MYFSIREAHTHGSVSFSQCTRSLASYIERHVKEAQNDWNIQQTGIMKYLRNEFRLLYKTRPTWTAENL